MSYGKLHNGDPFTYALDQDYGHLTDHKDDTDLDSISSGHQDGKTKEEYELDDLTAPRDTLGSRTSRHGHQGGWTRKEDGDNDDDGGGIDVDKIRRGSTSTTQSFVLYTPDEERSVVRKLDRRLVLFVALLYMLSFLDRSSM